MKFLRCKICGKIVAMVNDCSSCPTKCCGEAMEEIPVNTTEGAYEKHLPVYVVEGNIVKVKVGEVAPLCLRPSPAWHRRPGQRISIR